VTETQVERLTLVVAAFYSNTAGDRENNTTHLIKNTRLNLTDALLQIKAWLLHCTLGTFGDRTGRGILLLRKCGFSVLYFQVDDD